MGAGASATWKDDLKDASADDVQKKWDEMSQEERDALSTEDRNSIKVALGEKYLKAACEVMSEAFGGLINAAMENPEAGMADPPPELEEKINVQIRNAFKGFDADDSGQIDGEEAKAFFSALVATVPPMIKSLAMKMFKLEMAGYMNAMGADTPAEEIEAVKKQGKEAFDKQMAKMDEEVAKYSKNKEARDAAAWKVIDTNKDGKISLDEMLKVLNPMNDDDDLFIALGIMACIDDEDQASQADE